MSDSAHFTGPESAFDDETQPHHPKHRRDDVPVDAQVPAEPLLGEFGENPDTSLTG